MTIYLFGFLLFVFIDAVVCMAIQKRFNILGSIAVGSLWFVTIPVSILVVCCWQEEWSKLPTQETIKEELAKRKRKNSNED